MYRIPELAEMFGCHPETVRRYIREGKLKAVKPSRDFYVTEQQLLDFQNNNTTGNEEE